MPDVRGRTRRGTRGEPRSGRGRAGGPGSDRRRSLILTTALATVLLGLGGYTILGTLDTNRATNAHRQSLTMDAQFSEARNAIALEEVHVRHYQVEPSVAVRLRFVEAAGSVTTALDGVQKHGRARARADAQRLAIEQAAYRRAADRLLAMMADQDPASVQLDRLDVTPAYYTLQQDIDNVSRAYHATAEREAAELSTLQSRLLVGTTIGFGLGLTLVAMIWRLVLGYQRRLLASVASSERMALHDVLTELPNRAYFNRRLREAVDDAGRHPRHHMALMILDLNGFKPVNDTLGHQAGDQLLVAVGQRLREAVRDGDVVSRLGGDEFGVVLPHVADRATVRQIADRINTVLRSDFSLPAGPAAISGSIGVAMGPSRGDMDELVRHADYAMYRAKSSGGGVAFYDPSTDLAAPDKMGLYGELRALVDAGDPGGQLAMYYQPQVRISDGTVNSAEALVRWLHPSRGTLMPDDFLPLAESRGLEIPLTYHLLATAVDQAVDWHRAGTPMIVSVNVSPRCLLDSGFVTEVLGIVSQRALPPQLLRLEITEKSVITDPERAVTALCAVHDFGIQISVDDYGTGFSSMAQLKRLPADELKIDRSFVYNLTADTGDEVLVRSTVALGHDLGMSTVAEGVEDLAALALLGELGCDYAQGFVLSPAVPAAELPEACRRAEQLTRDAYRRLPTVSR